MASNVDAAIKARWDAQSVGSTITGGAHFSELPRADAGGNAIAAPYAIISHVGKAPTLWTSKSQYQAHDVQFAVYDDTKTKVEGHLAAIKAAFDFAPLAIDGADFLELRPTNDDGLVEKEDDAVWQGILTYRARYGKPVTYNPS